MSRFARPAAIVICLVLVAPAAFAQGSRNAPAASEGTSEEQDACHRDAMRFCKDAVPDTFKVLTCLQSNRTKIREACKAVLRSHGVLEPPSNDATIDR